tara:strand:+ start:265 stop:456 length:192 start_codon:yes stop_codon:yes gene_type:complete
MTALSKSVIAEKIRLESLWNAKFLSEGKETIDMKSIDAKLQRLKNKLKCTGHHSNVSPLFIPE